jgi:hypothetical protein
MSDPKLPEFVEEALEQMCERAAAKGEPGEATAILRRAILRALADQQAMPDENPVRALHALLDALFDEVEAQREKVAKLREDDYRQSGEFVKAVNIMNERIAALEKESRAAYENGYAQAVRDADSHKEHADGSDYPPESADSRFIEALSALMPWLKAVEANMGDTLSRRILDAADAFADARCEATGCVHTIQHEMCRAELRRRIEG